MLKSMLVLIFLSIICIANAQQISSPFGIPMNAKKQDIIKLGGAYQEKYKNWRISIPPVPNSSFDFYTISYTEKYGICQIRAIGKTITTTQYGDGVKDQFSSLRNALASKYGTDRKYDFLHAKSIWEEDKYWMRSLEQNERSLASFWNVASGANLPTDIKEIVVVANALSSTEGYVDVMYRSKNYDACKTELEKANTDGL